MGTIVSQITSLTIVYSTVYSDAIKENIKAPHHWPLCGEFTGDRWISRTNGQLRGNVSIWWRHHGFLLNPQPGHMYQVCTHSWWHHQMDTFSSLLAFCVGNSPTTGEFLPKGQWRRALMFSLICVWINSWVNNHESVGLRRHQAHYDVILMFMYQIGSRQWRRSWPLDLRGW